uniref:Uncharacterized protein n=1 Tax=Oryza meridionalis TaxID=40149 RepID=A0A0E0F8G8_9ORYZ
MKKMILQFLNPITEPGYLDGDGEASGGAYKRTQSLPTTPTTPVTPSSSSPTTPRGSNVWIEERLPPGEQPCHQEPRRQPLRPPPAQLPHGPTVYD